ncbi:hypothetical protein [Marinilabilia salmonicolor]|uniref:Uncharacterized protein n=1 Tax=Marinilabilia salmonicolor TaxID=989 RepID=A0A368US49_9BACT|nr:hypothetical protein [Marinilabilia salmonicolor]RCW29671.1 hypothetical protein DFO77_12628 [Marinilabilia salmonicolor]
MILITSVNEVECSFPDYIFSSQRVRFVEGEYVIIDNEAYIASSIRKVSDLDKPGGIVEVPLITDLPFDGNRTVKRAGIPQINPAAISVKGFLEKYFYPFVPAEISFAGNDAIFEYGTSQNVTLRAVINANDETEIANRRIIHVTNADSLVYLGTTNDFSTQITIQGDETAPLHNKKQVFKALADVGGNGSPASIASAMRTYNFYYPVLYGMGPLLSGATIYNGLTKLVVAESIRQFAIPLNGENQYIWFASPFNNVKPVFRDNNGFDVSDSFSMQNMMVTTSKKYPLWTFGYFVWRSIAPTSVANKTFSVIYP